jgi:hypothetical protein
MMWTRWVRRSKSAPARRSSPPENLGPFRKGQIGRDDQADLLVVLAEEAEEILGSCFCERDISEFVDEDQVAATDLSFQTTYLSLLPGLVVEVDQSGCGKRGDSLPLPTVC